MTQTQQVPDANDVLMGGSSAPTAKFTQPGDTVGGRIVAPPRAYQEREYDRNNPGKGAPKHYPSGDPIMSITVDVQTNLRDAAIDNDDGIRRIYVEGKRLKAAVRQAVLDGGAQKLEVGGELHVQFTGLGQAEPGISAPKEYAAKYTPAGQAAFMAQGQPAAPVQHVDSFQSPGPAPAWAGQPTPEQAPPPQQPAAPAAPAVQAGPSPEQIAAVRAAGLDPATVFPGYTG